MPSVLFHLSCSVSRPTHLSSYSLVRLVPNAHINIPNTATANKPHTSSPLMVEKIGRTSYILRPFIV